MTKIILDTDPGIDDAIAICYAMAHPDIELLALTTIYGNVHTTLATDNALRLAHLNNQNTPVATGASTPLHITPNPIADFVHGENGLGGAELQLPDRQAESQTAAELIVDTINKHPGEITLVAVGPLTNLALALRQQPSITESVAQVVVMGGAFHHVGNVTPHAEANIWNDPHAAKEVFNADWPIVVHGLDVTYQIRFDRTYLENLAKSSPKVGGFINSAAQFYIEYYKREHEFDGCCPHDLLALSYLTQPEWYKLETGELDVITEGDSAGKTTIDQTIKSKKQVAIEVQSEALLKDYAAIIANHT